MRASPGHWKPRAKWSCVHTHGLDEMDRSIVQAPGECMRAPEAPSLTAFTVSMLPVQRYLNSSSPSEIDTCYGTT